MKIIFNWYLYRNPDSGSVKNKMLYAGSKDALTGVLVGIMVKINPTDLSEFTEDDMVLQANKV